MARSRAELVANLRAFKEIWADRLANHPAASIREQAVGAEAMYRAAVHRADRGAALDAVCGELSGYARQLHGCRDAIEREREEVRARAEVRDL